jgi:ubiquinol oxidase
MTIAQPSLFMRLMILGAQGVFFNAFFLSYLVAPKSCHRFVNYLEQEAVHTYTQAIKEIEAGRLPEWQQLKAPQIAVEYWRLPDGASLLDMIYAVRADEAQHRFVNGSLANLKDGDPNPFALMEAPATVRGSQVEFTREEALAWGEKVSHEVRQKLQENVEKEKTA